MKHEFNINNRWFVIVNPVSGSGRGLHDWPIISTLLHESGIHFDALFTQRKYHATELAVYAVNQGYRRLIVVGGDGTIHETVNGLFIQTKVKPAQVLISVIAVGTGNDWVRMFGIPRTYTDAVRSIIEEHTFLQDVGRVTYWESKFQQTRYMANVGGVAYDAKVCADFNRLKENGYKGKRLYRWSIVREALRYKSRKVQIIADGKEVFNKRLLSASVGIGKYTGGGLQQTPYAIPDDGLFDITIIPKMNRIRFFAKFKVLLTDNIYNVRGIELKRASRVEINSKYEIPLEVDGEALGVSNFTFEIIPKAITVIVSAKFLGKQL